MIKKITFNALAVAMCVCMSVYVPASTRSTVVNPADSSIASFGSSKKTVEVKHKNEDEGSADTVDKSSDSSFTPKDSVDKALGNVNKMTDTFTDGGIEWDIDDDGLLRIGANVESSTPGKMRDYSPSNAPWYRYSGSIKNIEIEQDVLNIGNYAFAGLYNVTGDESGTLDLSNAYIESIGSYAFDGMANVSTLIFGAEVTKIGDYAFKGMTGLSTLDLSLVNILSPELFGKHIFDGWYSTQYAGIIVDANYGMIYVNARNMSITMQARVDFAENASGYNTRSLTVNPQGEATGFFVYPYDCEPVMTVQNDQFIRLSTYRINGNDRYDNPWTFMNLAGSVNVVDLDFTEQYSYDIDIKYTKGKNRKITVTLPDRVPVTDSTGEDFLTTGYVLRAYYDGERVFSSMVDSLSGYDSLYKTKTSPLKKELLDRLAGFIDENYGDDFDSKKSVSIDLEVSPTYRYINTSGKYEYLPCNEVVAGTTMTLYRVRIEGDSHVTAEEAYALEGAELTLKPTISSGYRIDHWGDEDTSSTSREITVSGSTGKNTYKVYTTSGTSSSTSSSSSTSTSSSSTTETVVQPTDGTQGTGTVAPGTNSGDAAASDASGEAASGGDGGSSIDSVPKTGESNAWMLIVVIGCLSAIGCGYSMYMHMCTASESDEKAEENNNK